MSHPHMSQMPAHGVASQRKVANGREGFQMGSYAPGMAGGRAAQMTCAFPAPPPKRCYCHPAAFTSLDGRSHSRLLDAYGSSRPCQSYY